MKDLQAVILCGGLGTRLREETEFKPKPMVEIGGRPILWHIMRHYRTYGVKDFVLCLGYRGDAIRNYFMNYRQFNHDLYVDLESGKIDPCNPNHDHVDWHVMLAETGADSLTGQRLIRARRHVKSRTFFATYGDGVANVDIERLLAHHRRAGKMATVTAVHPSSRFGELVIEGGSVTRFEEKPQVAEGWINGGFFVFEKEALDVVAPDANVTLEDAILTELARRGELSVYQHDGFWQCMDTYREMQMLNEMWASGKAPWTMPPAAAATNVNVKAA